MIPIGTPYDRKNMNCAHFVADWFKVPAPDNELVFIRWMRRHFIPIEKQEEGCLVVAGPPLHVGIYHDWAVQQAYNDRATGGQVIRMELAMFKQLHKNIRFYRHDRQD